ncbi:lunapark b isoform 1 [Mucor ambiguus]|uniref:Endoplasmic reticulum junction formation protein lunapark n=1 Tax=Mucor ambiguus TaxID=91626 RepID=A0A0C9N3X3_9FUNG|nr:lunapark b isoform 1 [Mucor ambiguus]
MGTLFSKEKSDSDSFEKVLSKYDDDIQKYEIQLSDIRIQDRRVSILWVLYSTALWTIYIAYYLYMLHAGYSNNVKDQLLAAVPILLGPLCIYYVRKGVKWIYSKRLNSITTNLNMLRKKQKLKVEELKKKTAYYSTKSLLERYDPASEKKKEFDEIKRKKAIEEREKQKVLQRLKQKHSNKNPVSTMNQQPHQQQQPRSQPWYDKLVDALVGDVGPETKYALICIHCNAHNGLVLPQEMDTIQYTCPHCNQFNPSRKSRSMPQSDGSVSPTVPPKPDHDESIDLVTSDSSNSNKSATKDTSLQQRKTAEN